MKRNGEKKMGIYCKRESRMRCNSAAHDGF